MGCDEYIEAREEGWEEGHADGYDDGHEDGRAETLGEIESDPGSLFRGLKPYQWQDWFDRLKAEAARLGVRV